MAGSKTDFNDLHIEAGLQAVKDQLLAALEGHEKMPAPVDDNEPPPWDEIPPDAYEGEAENSPNHSPTVRKPLLGDKTVLEASEVAGRMDLAAVLERFFYLAPSGEVWDATLERRMKKTAFKDFVTAAVAKEWLEHDARQGMTDDDVNAFVRAKFAQERATRPPSWTDNFQRNDNNDIRADIANAKLVLDNDTRFSGVLGYCDFSYRIMKRKRPPFAHSEPGEWTDTDTDRLRIWLSENYGFTPKNADALGAVVVAAEGRRFHPVREYLEGLKWDGVSRVDTWLHDYLGAQSLEDKSNPSGAIEGHITYHSLVSRFWMVGAVARVMRPPVKVDNVLIFEGLQGLGKSTALSILGGEWFTDTPLEIGAKDGFQQMQGVWIIELAELDSLNKAESTRAKQFFGSSVDKYRPSYGRMVQTFARQCVFAGSTNQDAYLKDATGNRRYWPVKCSRVDKEALQRDRDQLWAEAFHLFKEGATWYPLEEHKRFFEPQQDARFDEDVWQDKIEGYLYGLAKGRVTMYEIMEEGLGLAAAQMKPPEQKRIGQIMARLRWHKVRARAPGGKRESAYEAPSDWSIAPVAGVSDSF
ncbi:virulence-associated E family protein [Gilvimarinus agarilyticus]|uniref:virulence-associated E family protein n=1 Tax=Gilvimarinus agarilyticus TaxID=679259 RepID=UPI0006962DE0|nr:virulence-associated E family protein [Gilvimarinus agarilyticus]